MEITLNVKLSASPELLDILKNITTQVTVWNDKPKVASEAVETTEAVAPKEKKAKVAKTEETKAVENGQPAKADETKAIGLSDIRQHIAKSEANKTAARALLPEYGIKALTDLPADKYNEFYKKLTLPVDDL